MTLPNFAAEASLYASSARYHRAPTPMPSEGLLPAQSIFERRPDLIDDAIVATEPLFNPRLCWLPYWTWCMSNSGRPYRCLTLRYIC